MVQDVVESLGQVVVVLLFDMHEQVAVFIEKLGRHTVQVPDHGIRLAAVFSEYGLPVAQEGLQGVPVAADDGIRIPEDLPGIFFLREISSRYDDNGTHDALVLAISAFEVPGVTEYASGSRNPRRKDLMSIRFLPAIWTSFKAIAPSAVVMCI